MNAQAHIVPYGCVPAPTDRRALLCIFLAALILRAGWGLWRLVTTDAAHTLEFPDEQQYWLMARNLADGRGLVDEFGFRATRMPLYPALLSLCTLLPAPLVAARVLHWFVGALTPVLTVLLGRALLDRRTALLGGWWAALDPFLIFFSSLLLVETFFIASLLFLWWLTARYVLTPERVGWSSWVRIGIAGALCVYLKEAAVGLFALLLPMLVIFKGCSARAIGGVVLAGLIVTTLLIPWALRNERVTGSRTLLTHRGGISLYDGVGPRADGSSNLADIQQNDEVRGLDEVAWDRHFRRASWEAMRRDPERVVRLAGIKLARTWNPVPNVETYRSAIVRTCAAVWTIPTLALAVAGIILLPKRGTGGAGVRLFLLLPTFYLSAVHCVFVGSVRYRLPAMPMLELLAALAAVVILRKLIPGVRDGESRSTPNNSA